MTTPGRKNVKPRDGFHIVDPFTRMPIPPEGCEVVTTGIYGTHIQKLINGGDLIDLDAEQPVQNALREVGVDQRKGESFTKKGQ